MVVTFIVTVRLAMPLILVALAVVAMIGGSLLVVILMLGLLKWDRFAVVMRAATQQVRALDYVAAAEAAGASRSRIIVGEILPNVLPHLIVVATVEAAQRHPARGGAVLPRPRRAAAAAVLGPDDRRSQDLHVLLVLADRDSRARRLPCSCSPSTSPATACAT